MWRNHIVWGRPNVSLLPKISSMSWHQKSVFSVSPALPYAPWLVQKRSRFFVGGVAQTRQAKVRWQKEMKTVSYMSICTTAKNKGSPQSLLKLHICIKWCAQMCAMFRCAYISAVHNTQIFQVFLHLETRLTTSFTNIYFYCRQKRD